MLGLDGDACLWNIFGDVLESEGYAVCKACNDAESLFEKYQAASRLSIKRVIATYTNVSLVVGNSS